MKEISLYIGSVGGGEANECSLKPVAEATLSGAKQALVLTCDPRQTRGSEHNPHSANRDCAEGPR